MIRHAPWDSPPHDFSIGLKPIDEVSWLEGGEADAARKTALLAGGAEVWGEQADSRPAQAEVLALVEQATGELGDPAVPPLWGAGLLCADDLCLMERRDGVWRLTAASLCSGTFFTAADALGKSLAELHDPVPGFDDRFLSVVERMFNAVQPGVIMERRNWTLLNSNDLHLPRSAPVRALIPGIALADAASSLFLRVERQTVRKLPKARAVLFTIRVWRHSLAALRNDQQRLAAFARAWRGVSDDFRAYKGLAHYDRLVEAFLASN